MAQKYYNVKEAAEFLGVTPDDIKTMLERRELHGYRDGADWKFKAEAIEQKKNDMPQKAETPEVVPKMDSGDDDQDVLLSEVELGESAIGASGTVIGLDSPKVADDLTAAVSDIKVGSPTAPAKPAAKAGDSGVAAFEDLDLTLDADAPLESASAKRPSAADSTVDLTGKKLEDDELVLGGSSTGSGVTLGGDSGISLVDPADSGLSLEEPLSLNAGGEESLELGEDDMLTLSPDTSSPSMKGEDDFQLTPLVDVGDADDSESGSQVIALDNEGDEAATMLGSSSPAMAAMLEEDLSSLPMGDHNAPMGAGMGFTPDGGIPLQPTPDAMLAYQMLTLPETPYTAWNIVFLVFCFLLLILCGMFMHDLLRNMWSWDGASATTSPMMDWVISLFEGK